FTDRTSSRKVAPGPFYGGGRVSWSAARFSGVVRASAFSVSPGGLGERAAGSPQRFAIARAGLAPYASHERRRGDARLRTGSAGQRDSGWLLHAIGGGNGIGSGVGSA